MLTFDATERRAAYNQGSAQPPKGTMSRQRETLQARNRQRNQLMEDLANEREAYRQTDVSEFRMRALPIVKTTLEVYGRR